MLSSDESTTAPAAKPATTTSDKNDVLPATSRSRPEPFDTWHKDAIALIHLHKAGGTTLHNLLKDCFKPECVCPLRQHELHLHSPISLAKYDFFSGHFDYYSSRFIPRKRVRLITLFREPRARLVSFYRFNKAHMLVNGFERNLTIQLANELTPEEFFEDSRIARIPFINNAYLFYFGTSLYDHDTRDALVAGGLSPDSASKLLTTASDRIAELDAFGLTERFDESVKMIFATLGLQTPKHIQSAMVTDELTEEYSYIKKIPPVEMSPRLEKALARLTIYDDVIYGMAKSEFQRRRLLHLPDEAAI